MYDVKDFCDLHLVEMTPHSNETGTWYSHKLEDGTWCNGKPKKGVPSSPALNSQVSTATNMNKEQRSMLACNAMNNTVVLISQGRVSQDNMIMTFETIYNALIDKIERN